MRTLLGACGLLVVFVVAVSDAGPRRMNAPRFGQIFGSDPPPMMDPDCNTTDNYDKKCPSMPGSNPPQSCGATYKEIVPVNPGDLMDVRYQNSNQVRCDAVPGCVTKFDVSLWVKCNKKIK